MTIELDNIQLDIVFMLLGRKRIVQHKTCCSPT